MKALTPHLIRMAEGTGGRLVIFDLDCTLVDSRLMWDPTRAPPGAHVVNAADGPFYVFVRNGTSRTLRECVSRGHSVAVWSAARRTYVDEIIRVLERTMAPSPVDLRFVWTAEQTTGGFKDLDVVARAHPHLTHEQIVLIDDSLWQCVPNTQRGYRCIRVPPFYAEMEAGGSLLGDPPVLERLLAHPYLAPYPAPL